MKRSIAVFLTGVLTLGLLTGCGQGGKSTEDGKDTGSKDGEVLTMMLNGADSDAYVEGYRKIIDAFNADNEYGVTIEPEFFLPSVICGVAVGLTWTFIYNGNYGLLNAFLKFIGLGSLSQVWLANKNLAMFCIIIVIMWQYVGYHMVIQLAAMRNIDASFYEAAEIDGATGWQQFKYITFPMIKPILKVDTVLIITGSLKYYDLVAVMTSGGPNHATEVMSTYMYYQAFNVLKYGYASAIGVILMILCIMAVGISNTVFRAEKDV